MAASDVEIIKAFTDKSNILDRFLADYQCETGMFGDDVLSYNGGFCVTVPMKRANEAEFSKCLRIWYANLSHMKERSNLVSIALRSSSLSYFVDYEYIDQALRVGGVAVPGIRMDWLAKATTLRDFLLKQSPTAQQLKKLADNFYRMCADLNRAGFAHGDLSSSNILINPDMSLKLIDYDSMYVPSMGNGYKQQIVGTDGYQHPQRSRVALTAGKNNDYFSQQVIYAQLLAFALRPQLCSQVSDRELLFNSNDLASPQAFRASSHYRLLSSLNDRDVQFYLDELEKAIGLPINQVRSVCDLPRREEPLDPPRVMFRNRYYCPECGTRYTSEASTSCNRCRHPREVERTW